MKMRKTILVLTFCMAFSAVLLTACDKEVPEDPTQASTQAAQSQTQTTYPLGSGELPPVVIPPQTQPATEPTEDTQPQNTEPANTTEPMLGEDELPPIVVG